VSKAYLDNYSWRKICSGLDNCFWRRVCSDTLGSDILGFGILEE
jgi:hypothetical protein